MALERVSQVSCEGYKSEGLNRFRRPVNSLVLMESLILAQDERWRRA